MSDSLFPDSLSSSAVVSPCERYRYSLDRRWSADATPAVVFVMLNPSTADADADDPTIRRCVGFAKAWGFSALHVVNLFAFRATKPVRLKYADDPIGPENDEHLRRAMDIGTPVVAAWGEKVNANERLRERAKYVRDRLIDHLPSERRRCLGVTVSQPFQPRHPLFVPRGTPMHYLGVRQ